MVADITASCYALDSKLFFSLIYSTNCCCMGEAWWWWWPSSGEKWSFMLLQYIAGKLMLLFLFLPLSSSLNLWDSRYIGPWLIQFFLVPVKRLFVVILDCWIWFLLPLFWIIRYSGLFWNAFVCLFTHFCPYVVHIKTTKTSYISKQR
jgi:hypothetical protein